MLRQVVVQNILVFKGRHAIDFGGNTGCNFYSFVGENASGKSALIDLIKSAGNFSTTEPHFDVISSGGDSAKVVCEFEFANGGELPHYFGECKSSKFYPLNTRVAGLNSWFAADVLKIPTSLAESITEIYADIKSKIQVFVGYRYQLNNEDPESVENQSLNGQSGVDSSVPLVSQFLYLLCHEFSFVAVKLGGVLRTGLHDPIPGGIDPVEWIPVESSLRNVRIQNLYPEGAIEPTSPLGCGDAFEFNREVGKSHMGTNGDGRFSTLSYYQQKIQTLSRLVDQFPKCRLGQIQSLFNEIVGNKSIIFQEKVGHPLCLFDTKTNRAVERIPEGHYSAFIVAALLVKLSTRTILLDEPTRGMHPLQIRRLRRILMRESVNRNKCVIAVTHSPEMVDVERITLICRFQMLPSGYCRISRVTSGYGPRDLHFIGGSEVRELFFTKIVIWVEGESDKRFFEVLLRLFDRENRDLWKLLLDKPLNEEMTDSEDGRRARAARLASAVENHLLDPVYARQYFSAEELSAAQEACHSCSVLPLGGKKNMGKGIAICRDLGIPYAVICDLDALIPNSRENSILQQFENCKGNWSAAKLTNPKVNLVDEESCPACKCIDGGHAGLTKLKGLRTVREVMENYEKEINIFSWRVNNGEIEDAVRLTKSQFGKKLWSEFSDHNLEKLILQLIDPKKLLHLNPKDKDGHKEPNQEILRCIYFLLGFFKKILEK